jgi:formyltetrahydrofolate deformylase
MNEIELTAVLLLSCADRKGLVSRISHFIFERGGNILSLNEYVEPEESLFSIRVSWSMVNFSISAAHVVEAFSPLAREFSAHWSIKFVQQKHRVAVFVSKYDHCLREILWRYSLGEFGIEIPLIISNHPDLESVAERYDIPFHVFSIVKSNRLDQEKKELALLAQNKIDTIVLARYMQILSHQMVGAYPHNIINIHHSFLPAFVGGNPYRQAYTRGVKIIGATSHFVTEELDEGPIIEQDIVRITHKDSLLDLKRKGRDLERIVLARALMLHAQHRILVNGKKTIIFD